MATKNKETVSEEKQYSLKDIELRVVANINARANAEMLDFLSFISLERLNYEVTSNTTFKVDDGTLFINEVIPEPTPEEKPTEEVSVA